MANKEREKLFAIFKSLNKEDRQKIITRGQELKAEETKKSETRKEETKKKQVTFSKKQTDDKYIRVTFAFSSNRTTKAHEPLFIQAITDGLKSDSDSLYNILYDNVQQMYGEAVVESGKFSIDHIPYPQYTNYQIRYRRSENAMWKVWK